MSLTLPSRGGQTRQLRKWASPFTNRPVNPKNDQQVVTDPAHTGPGSRASYPS